MCDYIKAWDAWLEHIMRPASLSEHETSTDLIVAGGHELPELVHFNANEVGGHFVYRPSVDPESSGLVDIFDTMRNGLTLTKLRCGPSPVRQS